MSDESIWIQFPNRRKISPLSACVYDGDALGRVESDEERSLTPGRFEEGPGGSYGWRAVPPPGDGWTLDREASARKDYRVSYWRRPR